MLNRKFATQVAIKLGHQMTEWSEGGDDWWWSACQRCGFQAWDAPDNKGVTGKAVVESCQK